MIPLGQFRDTFIIAVDDEGIAIIDQHVAHERVLFERTMERLTAGRLQSQRLLHPLLLDLTPDGRQALVAHAADLERLGFEVEEFGGDSVRVCATPALLDAESAAAAVRALAQDLEGLDRGARVEETLKRIAATIACHAAVKANYPLTLRQNGPHPGGVACHGVLHHLSARAAGHAAADTPRGREELRAHLKTPSAQQPGLTASICACYSAVVIGTGRYTI